MGNYGGGKVVKNWTTTLPVNLLYQDGVSVLNDVKVSGKRL